MLRSSGALTAPSSISSCASDSGRAPALRLLPRPGEGANGALALHLFADSEAGLEHARGIDETISAVFGLEGLRLISDYVDGALRRVAERPGWAGIAPVPRRDRGLHDPGSLARERGVSRADVMPATTEVERREERAMERRFEAAPADGAAHARS